MATNLHREKRALLGAGVVLLVALLATALSTAWASPLGAPLRQTVPAMPVLEVEEGVVAPGEPAPFTITVSNPTGAALTGVVVTIGEIEGLTFDVPFVWEIGTMNPGDTLSLDVLASLLEGVAPGTEFVVPITMTWDGGGPLVQYVTIVAPGDLLPDTGF